MNISRFTDYSLRVLIYLAAAKNTSHIITIKEVAERYQISKNHLMKVVQELSANNHINATRGKNGGIKLNALPENINIGLLVRSIEQDSTLVECFGSDNKCVITSNCQLKKMFSQAMESFFHCLDQYTLADLVKEDNKLALRQVLKIPSE